MKTFLSTNIHAFKGDILICGTCVPDMEKYAFTKIVKGKSAYLVCLEKTHMNTVASKLNNMLSIEDIRSLSVLTMDGSPHCVQLHFAVEDAKRNTGFKGKVEHFVVEDGKLVKVSPENVRKARHLSMQ